MSNDNRPTPKEASLAEILLRRRVEELENEVEDLTKAVSDLTRMIGQLQAEVRGMRISDSRKEKWPAQDPNKYPWGIGTPYGQPPIRFSTGSDEK
jgi:predicted RNase H-like nuclease (RuvC/YqgF family)